MNVALSLGLRAPFVTWKNNQLIPNQDLKTENFPTSMLVDYIRVWELQNFPEQSD
jgi:hypothetical protein